VARPLTWVRYGAQVQHIIAVVKQRRFYNIQWGVACEEAATIVWDAIPDPTDVGYSVLGGTPGTIRHPAPGQYWTVTSDTSDDEVRALRDAVREDVAMVAERLRAFDSRRDVWTYLLENRDRKDPRDFLIPAHLPLKLLTAAALAAVDRDAVACTLLPEVETELSRYKDDLNHGRVARLRAATAELCG
jgi:hypothetical protein